MRTLFVAPVEQGSGEIVTCLHAAENLTAHGHDVRFLASDLACRYLAPRFAGALEKLTQDGDGNFAAWERTLRDFDPDAIVFADYPLLHFQTGTTPLADHPRWLSSLDAAEACLVTFDHFGFAQEEMGLFFGPPHLSFFYQRFPAIPDRMQIMLPCPMHEPGPVPGRRGTPFRYWQLPLGVDDATRRRVRGQYLENDNDWLVVHSVPNWAWRQAEAMNLSFYRYLGAFLDQFLGDLPRRVTVVSVNNGLLLKTPLDCRIKIVNLEPLPTTDFEALLFSADLVLTENSVSIAMGKAICALQTCAALVNSARLPEIVDRTEGRVQELILEMEGDRMGTVFPYRVYPTSMIQELERIILYRDNTILEGFKAVEIFAGQQTRDELEALLGDREVRGALRAKQQAYVDALDRLGDVNDVLGRLVAGSRDVRVTP